MSAVIDAIEAFWDYLASVQPLPLGIAICCHIAKTMCTSRAWRNVLAAAYPETRVRWISIYGAYIAGVGVNAILPARAGDVVRLTMAHRAVKGATYTTLVSSSLVLAIVDVVCGVSLFAWAITQGVLPGFGVLPSLPSFDFRWLFEHDRVGEIVLLLLVFGLIGLAIWVSAHVAEFRERVGQAFTIVHTPLALVPFRRAVAARRLGSAADDDLVHARRLRDRPVGSATCFSCRPRRASPPSCRSAPAASAPSRRSSSTRCGAPRREQRSWPSASACG